MKSKEEIKQIENQITALSKADCDIVKSINTLNEKRKIYNTKIEELELSLNN